MPKDNFDFESERARSLFNKLQARLKGMAKPSLKPHQVDAAFEKSIKSPGGSTPTHRGSYKMSVGFLGEGAREHTVQSRGEISLSEKLSFKNTNQGGFDGVTISRDKGGLWLNYDDNKAHASSGAVREASAVQKNYAQNRQAVLTRLNQIAADKGKPLVIRAAARLGLALANAGRDRVRIQNAGGNPNRTTIPGAQFDNISPQNWKFQSKGELVKEKQASSPLAKKYGVKPGTPIRSDPGAKGLKIVTKNTQVQEFHSNHPREQLRSQTAKPPARNNIKSGGQSSPTKPSIHPRPSPVGPRNTGSRPSSSPAPKPPASSPLATKNSPGGGMSSSRPSSSAPAPSPLPPSIPPPITSPGFR